jgi:O-antigen/teichoic acid export membrane protein
MGRSDRIPKRLGSGFKTVWVDAFLRRLARNASWGFASMVVEFVLSLGETTLVARVLGVADYGRLALVMASTASIKQIVDVRAWEGATRYLAEFLEKREPAPALATIKLAVLADTTVAVVAYGATVALAGPISGRLLHQPDLHGPIAWYALTALLTAINGTAEAVLRVFDRFRDLAVRSGVQAAAHLGLVAAVLLVGARIHGLVLAYLLSDLAGAVLVVGLAGRQVRRQLWAMRAEASVMALRPYFKGMLWFTLHTDLRATLKLNRQLDLLVLGYFRSSAEVGYYRVARRLGAALVDLSNPVYFAIFPQFARAWAGTQRQFATLVARTAGMAAAAALPGVLLGVWLAPQVIHVWVGPQYAPAVDPFRMVMVAMGLEVATLWGTPAALGSGRPGTATAAVAAGVFVNAGLLLLLVPRHGPTGAAIALLGGFVAYGVVISALLAHALRGQRRGRSERLTAEPR